MPQKKDVVKRFWAYMCLYNPRVEKTLVRSGRVCNLFLVGILWCRVGETWSQITDVWVKDSSWHHKFIGFHLSKRWCVLNKSRWIIMMYYDLPLVYPRFFGNFKVKEKSCSWFIPWLYSLVHRVCLETSRPRKSSRTHWGFPLEVVVVASILPIKDGWLPFGW